MDEKKEKDVCVPLDLRNATRDPEKKDEINRQGTGIGQNGDPMTTLSTGAVPGVICAGFLDRNGRKARSIGYEEENSATIRAGVVPSVICVHGSQDPICNSGHANAVNRNMGQENCVCQYGEVAGTLEARHDSSPCADRGQNIVCYENHAQDSRVKELTDGVFQQINAKAGMGGGNLPLIQYSVALAANTIGRQPQNGAQYGSGVSEERAFTLDTVGTQGVASFQQNTRNEVRFMQGDGEIAGALNAETGMKQQNYLAGNQTVRRLLPIETERLMGFPVVDVLEIGKMTKDEFIAWEIAVGNIIVDTENGKIYSTRTGGGRKSETPILLNGTETPTGYLVVTLREKEMKKQCRVHRIVWIAANGIPPAGMTIDHINNNKKDNRLENLQLMTSEENSSKAHADGLVPHERKISDEVCKEIVTIYEQHHTPIRALAQRFGVSKSRIHQLIHRVGWTKIPWRGKPAEQCPDGPRYKACGNSMCVNVMRWIGMRIELVERKMKREEEKK